jgi:hypothetical protein
VLIFGKLDGLNVSEICADHLRVPQNFVRRSVGQRTAIVEHVNPVRKISYHLHVVLDPDRRNAELTTDLQDQMRK